MEIIPQMPKCVSFNDFQSPLLRTVRFRLITLCLIGFISFKRKSTRKIKILEVSRLLLTGLVYMEFLDGRSWMSWLILCSTPICIWKYPAEFNEMIMGVTIHLCCPLVLLSSSYEPLFFLILAFHFRSWPVENEQKDLKDNTTHISMQDLMKAASLVSFKKNLTLKETEMLKIMIFCY